MLLHRLVSNCGVALIDPMRLELLPVCDAFPLTPAGFQNEAHLMPLCIRLDALAPRDQDALAQWIDEYVCAADDPPALMFAESECAFDRLLGHLRQLLILRMADRRRCLFRYYDPSVFRHVDWIFDDAQRAAIHGPVARFCYWDGHTWREACKPEVQPAARVSPDADQSARLGRVSALNSLLASCDIPRDSESRVALCKDIDGYLGRAQAKGWRDEADWEAFAERCLNCHRRFDEHPRVVCMLEQAAEDDCAFSDVVRSVDQGFWDLVSAELSATDVTTMRVSK